MFDPACHARIVARLRSLEPDAPARWGKMNAPRMIAHLTDQMTHTLGDVPVKPIPGPMRLPFVGHAIIYWIPWPKGRAKGPPEAFVTQPAEWDSDRARLESLLQRLVERGPGGTWPEHAKFGKMSGKDWGAFCAKHFDHHLRQFGC
jgi:hypothetical protein